MAYRGRSSGKSPRNRGNNRTANMRANGRRQGAFRGGRRQGAFRGGVGSGVVPEQPPQGPGACPTGMKVGPRPDGTMGCVPDNEGGRPITPPRDPGLGRRGPGGRRGLGGRNVMGSTIGGRDWGRRGRGNK